MNKSFESFVSLPAQDRRDVFDATAIRLDTLAAYVEKDFWVCLVLDILYHRLPDGNPKLFFKGGTSLSKAFGLIERFSEDIDLVVSRDDLGFAGDRDPTVGSGLSNKKRRAVFEELRAACSDYIGGEFRTVLTRRMAEVAGGCSVGPEEGDPEGQTLFIQYPTLYPSRDMEYVAPRVKIEAGARSAVHPSSICSLAPYISNELPDWSFGVNGVRVIAPQRTYWEKLLILHGVYCGYRDEERLPADRDRISRHYYDAAMITATDLGRYALVDLELLNAVRGHNLIAFRQAWKRFEEAVPGSVRLVPQARLRRAIERDYRAMEGMVLGDVPDFGWIMEQLEHAEYAINTT